MTANDDNTRPLESGVRRDFSRSLSYGEYLRAGPGSSAPSTPLSVPPHHDEMLFIIQHQTTELWLKLVLHELRSARDLLRADELAPALKRLARVKHIQRTLTEQWSVLATLTPTEYAEFRGFLGTSSGFQSCQYRAVEFMLGNKNRRHAAGVRPRPRGPGDAERAARAAERLRRVPALPAPARATTCRPSCSTATVTKAHTFNARAGADVHATSTSTPHEHWDAYEACEELVDLEDNFQLWRFRHLKTVERTIGSKRGTGGSSGVAVPAPRARAHLLPRAVRRPHRDRCHRPLRGCPDGVSAGRAGRPRSGARGRRARRGSPRCPAGGARARRAGRRSGPAGRSSWPASPGCSSYMSMIVRISSSGKPSRLPRRMRFSRVRSRRW